MSTWIHYHQEMLDDTNARLNRAENRGHTNKRIARLRRAAEKHASRLGEEIAREEIRDTQRARNLLLKKSD